MKQNEHIVDMITHFTDIVNGLKGFDRKYTNDELVSKMLRSLSEDWSLLRMLIENIKDINISPLEELYGTLMTYEPNNAEVKKKTRKNKEESNEPSKRQIALNLAIDEETTNDNMNDEDSMIWSFLSKNRGASEIIENFKRRMKMLKREARKLYDTIVTSSVTKDPNVRTKGRISRKRYYKLHGTKLMMMIKTKMIAKMNSPTYASWL